MPRRGPKNRRREEEEPEEEHEDAPAEHAETDEDDYESEDDDDGAGGKRRSGSSSSRRGGGGGGGGGSRKRVKLMCDSGQTDAERRELRREQRELQREIATGEKGDKIEDPDDEAFADVRGRNNALWSRVRFTREAVLDGDNLELIAARAARQADKLVEVPRYDATRFSLKLRSKLTATSGPSLEYFDWRTLGAASGACFNAVPSRVSFLQGPLAVEFTPRERKKPERRARAAVSEEDDGEEERPDEVHQKKGDRTSGDRLSAVEKNIDVVNKMLNRRCRDEVAASVKRMEERIAGRDDLDEESKKKHVKKAKKHGQEVDAVRYLFNPRSFTQTVENVFHFSFLVRKGIAGIGVRSEEESERFGGAGPGPVVRATRNPNEAPTPRQAIVSLTMQDWREMCEAYSVTQSDIPHRGTSRRSRGGASQSSQN